MFTTRTQTARTGALFGSPSHSSWPSMTGLFIAGVMGGAMGFGVGYGVGQNQVNILAKVIDVERNIEKEGYHSELDHSHIPHLQTRIQHLQNEIDRLQSIHKSKESANRPQDEGDET